MEGTLESTRDEWEEGNRRLQAAAVATGRCTSGCSPRSTSCSSSCAAASASRSPCDELASAYGDADRWVQAALIEAEPAPGWPARSTIAQDAAFYLYSRGAIDYRP